MYIPGPCNYQYIVWSNVILPSPIIRPQLEGNFRRRGGLNDGFGLVVLGISEREKERKEGKERRKETYKTYEGARRFSQDIKFSVKLTENHTFSTVDTQEKLAEQARDRCIQMQNATPAWLQSFPREPHSGSRDTTSRGDVVQINWFYRWSILRRLKSVRLPFVPCGEHLQCRVGNALVTQSIGKKAAARGAVLVLR